VKWLWAPAHFWPLWLGLFTVTFLIRESTALGTGRPQDTLSDWVWRVLHVSVNQPIQDWDALHFLVFGEWLVLFGWLTYHFFFHRFA